MTEDPARTLPGFQRKHLRKLAHGRKAAVMVGSGGVSEAVHKAVEQALCDHELIVVKLHQPADKKGMAAALAERARAEMCGLVGHTVILYRANPDDPKIELPQRSAP
jgi:RNA-binding protein